MLQAGHDKACLYNGEEMYMSDEQWQGLVKRQRLGEREITEILQLLRICNAYENIHIRIIVRSLALRSDDIYHDFLYYEQGQLVGYIMLDGEGDDGELTGMVHPEYRRRGLFRTMLNALYEECRWRGVERLILVCERSSPSGQAFMRTLADKVTPVLAEHEMVLTDYRPRAIVGEHVALHLMTWEDVAAVVAVMAASDEEAERMRSFFVTSLRTPGERFYLGTLHGQPVGVLRLVEMGDGRTGIYTFNVRPTLRGRGYGRQMLQAAIHIAREERAREIMLEVDIENTNALGLYRSVGFTVKTTYEYYQLNLQIQ